MRLLACTLAAAGLAFAQAAADIELKAMHDELERSRTISLPNLDSPYFVQYLIDEAEGFSVSASLGGVLSQRAEQRRNSEVRVRVGDYSFDNSNFPGGFGSGTRYDLERFPLADIYSVLRRYLWLQTDSAYKAAVEALSRKKAALRNVSQNERINDLAHAEPVRHLRPIPKLEIDKDYWTKRVRSASALFAQYPELKNSDVEFEAAGGGYTLANTEGTEVREPQSVHFLRIRAIAQAADGMTLRDSASFYSLDLMHLPDDGEITRAVKTVAENAVALARAPKGEDYSGPVLFEGAAGAQIFAEVLGRNLGLTRRPVSDGGRGGGGYQPSELEGRIGARVLPDSFDVVDDPTQTDWRGRPLLGHYEVDLEGVLPAPVKVIEKGALKNYLLTRQPVRGYEGSNGRARLPGNYGASAASFSNLFVRSSSTVPVAELKKKLIEICQARGKAYGILVRKMDFPSTAAFDEARRMVGANQGGRPISMPALIYRVYPDGREELVRAMRFRGLNVRSLKDILAAGDDNVVFNYMDNGAVFALLAAGGATAESAVIAPSILVDDLELHPVEDEQPKLPLVTAPELTVK